MTVREWVEFGARHDPIREKFRELVDFWTGGKELQKRLEEFERSTKSEG